MKKILGLFVLAFAVLGLAACSSKDANGIPNVLQDKYTGYSSDSASGGSVFSSGSSELVFDKKNNTITNTSSDDKDYFKVIPEDKLNTEAKGALVNHKSEVDGKDHFFISVSPYKENLNSEVFVYCVILTDGGKSIRIFELEHSGKVDGWYDFIGQAD